MSWGQIKSAVNSTVGTSDFKPLDQIWKQGWVCTASSGDPQLASFEPKIESTSGSTTLTYTLSNKIKMESSGALFIGVRFIVNSTSRTCTYTIYKNGVEAVNATTSKVSTSGNTTTTVSTVEYEYGDVLTFEASANKSDSIKDIIFKGDIKYIPALGYDMSE